MCFLLTVVLQGRGSDERSAAVRQRSQSERNVQSLDGFNSQSQRANPGIAAILFHRRVRQLDASARRAAPIAMLKQASSGSTARGARDRCAR